MKEFLEITLNYTENKIDITASYRISEATLRRALSWKAQTANSTAKDLSDWLRKHGGKLHHANGPALVERHSNVRILEEHYTNGKLNRTDGPARVARHIRGKVKVTRAEYYTEGKLNRADWPAVVEHRNDYSTLEEHYTNGKLNCADGPAVVERKRDGSYRKEYYTNGKFVRTELGRGVPPPSAILREIDADIKRRNESEARRNAPPPGPAP